MYINLTADSWELIVRLLVAALLGALIGLERDIHGRAAGLRTHLLVCMGAALFMIISESMTDLVQYRSAGNAIILPDPGRIAAQVVTGIGFLGAGTIIKEGFNVRGLTTAACLWMAAAIGLSAGIGSYTLACASTFIALCSLLGLNYFEKCYPKDIYRRLIVCAHQDTDISTIVDAVKRKNLRITHCLHEKDYESAMVRVDLSVRIYRKGGADKLSHAIFKSLEDANVQLKSIQWDGP